MTLPTGLFVTLEGVEGAGKSSAMQFIRRWLIAATIPHLLTREPGGTSIAESIRHLLLQPCSEKMTADTELLLMFASRAQHVAHLINPALQSGKWVICDRFTDTTYAYQGGGRGMNQQRITQLEDWVQKGLRPNRVILLDLPVELGMDRIQQRQVRDRIEQERRCFFERARQVYLARAAKQPSRYSVVDASQPIDRVHASIQSILESLANGWIADAQ